MPENCIYHCAQFCHCRPRAGWRNDGHELGRFDFLHAQRSRNRHLSSCRRSHPLREIVRDKICGQFEVDPEQAQSDAEQFVTELSSRGILLVSSQPLASEAHR